MSTTSPDGSTQFIDMSKAMDLPAAWAAGSIVSTAQDILTFIQALFSGQLLQPTYFAMMNYFVGTAGPAYAMVKSYGLGLVSMEIAGIEVIGHM